MLQSLTLSAINKYLGEYIDEVLENDLNVEFMNGEVVLRNAVPS